MNNTPIKYKDLDLNLLSFSKMRKNRDNPGKAVFLNYNGGQLLVQMPRMLARGNVYENKEKGTTNYYVNLSFYGAEKRPPVKLAHEIMAGVDDFCRNGAVENQKEWLKSRKKLSLDAVDALFKSGVRENVGKDGTEYANDMRVKVTAGKKGGFTCSVFDAHKNDQGTHDELELSTDNFEDIFGRNVPCTCLLQCTGLWFTDGKFGIGWKLVQVQVRRPQAQLTEYAIVPDSDDEADDDVQSGEEEGNAADDSDAEAEDADDSDSDEDEDEEPTPPPKKKSTRRKKSASAMADKA